METKAEEEIRSQVAPFRTGIDVSTKTRAELIPLLNQRLADLIDLFNQTKYAHWNVKGAGFIALHELFDQIAERVEESCDLVAERVVTLGGRAEGTTRQAAAGSVLPEYEVGEVDGLQLVRTRAIPRPPISSRRSRGHWTRTSGSWKHTCKVAREGRPCAHPNEPCDGGHGSFT